MGVDCMKDQIAGNKHNVQTSIRRARGFFRNEMESAFQVFRSRDSKAGMPPGTLMFLGEKKQEQVSINSVEYDVDFFQENSVHSIEDVLPLKQSPAKTWIRVVGIHDAAAIESIGKCFDLHPLIMEDILDSGQRAKLDEYEHHAFVVAKLFFRNPQDGCINSEQVSFVFGADYLISFHESHVDVFEPLLERIRTASRRIRSRGTDYLAYAILDTIIDNYFFLLDDIGEQIETLDAELDDNPDKTTLNTIRDLKRQTILLRQSIRPLKEVLVRVERDEISHFTESTMIFLRDARDHITETLESLDTFRDMLSGMANLYLSIISNKTNDVMKMLTIIASIFIPLTFLAGIYGMNFKYMPELGKAWAYPTLLCVMLGICVSLIVFFKKKKWL